MCVSLSYSLYVWFNFFHLWQFPPLNHIPTLRGKGPWEDAWADFRRLDAKEGRASHRTPETSSWMTDAYAHHTVYIVQLCFPWIYVQYICMYVLYIYICMYVCVCARLCMYVRAWVKLFFLLANCKKLQRFRVCDAKVKNHVPTAVGRGWLVIGGFSAGGATWFPAGGHWLQRFRCWAPAVRCLRFIHWVGSTAFQCAEEGSKPRDWQFWSIDINRWTRKHIKNPR